MAKAKFLVVYCLFISGLCCMANVTKDINMRFKDVRQGLSHQTVNCFYQDEFRFLWIGTQDGLNRFDGRKFEVFKPDNANPYSININNIRQVCGNKAGLLFIRSLQSVTLYDMRLNRFRVLRITRAVPILTLPVLASTVSVSPYCPRCASSAITTMLWRSDNAS